MVGWGIVLGPVSWGSPSNSDKRERKFLRDLDCNGVSMVSTNVVLLTSWQFTWQVLHNTEAGRIIVNTVLRKVVKFDQKKWKLL